MAVLANPALWASLAGLLAAIGVAILGGPVVQLIGLVGAICAIVGILTTLWQAGHRVRYEGPSSGA